MPTTVAEAFRSWHDFYILLGTGAATLIGAMFVVVSIGSSFLTERSEPQIRAFMTPTVVHLASIFIASLLTITPFPSGRAQVAAFVAGGLVGTVYAVRTAWHIGRLHRSRTPILLVDRLWYGGLPAVAYAIALVGATVLAVQAVAGLEIIAGGLVLLLIAGIRNSWDMIVFFAQRTEGSS